MTSTEAHKRHTVAHKLLDGAVLACVPVILALCAAFKLQAAAGLSTLVAIVSVLLMMTSFERSRPALRQIMPTVVLAAIAAAGRILFAPIPDVKPVSAICIVAGAVLGRRNGFMVGALAALISNAFFGQGAWTPWQMYAWGLVGYLGGVAGEAGLLNQSPNTRAAWGFASALLYGFILNSFHVIGFVEPLTPAAAITAYLAGLPWDIIHGVATAVFLLLIWEPWAMRIRATTRRYGL
ncbi:MAG: ECF transporter S component [Atopobiaceae bacterium]|nr:ECF transporter S component [Atopobiaceae bacterium]